MPEDTRHAELEKRDALTLKLLGVFFAVFGCLVLLGLFWDSSTEGRVINLGCGLFLVASGVGCCFFAKRQASRPGEDGTR